MICAVDTDLKILDVISLYFFYSSRTCHLLLHFPGSKIEVVDNVNVVEVSFPKLSNLL